MLTQTYLAHLPETLNALKQTDDRWTELRSRSGADPTQVIRKLNTTLTHLDYDVIIAGGTLGLPIALTLAIQGHKVAILERGILKGREQEWNISRDELGGLVELNMLTQQELDQAIVSEFNPIRIKFGDREIWTKDVLNAGVDPIYLLETLKQKFLKLGGKLIEQAAFKTATVHPNGTEIHYELNNQSNHQSNSITAQLLIDLMGHNSPVALQSRDGEKPDSVCLVVGTCATGYPENTTADLIASFTPIQNQCQYFWEAFPARDGRTTYLFTYLDAEPDRISLETLFDEYFRLLPTYQNITIDQLDIKRALFGIFPCYKDSPLVPDWDRILSLGDGSGAQSPLSFGGFGAMMRHLVRLSDALNQAISTDCLNRASLELIQPYQPNLQVTWLFQKSMSVKLKQKLPPEQINQLLADVFGEMEQLGDLVLKPFLQDVVQFGPLTQTLWRSSLKSPLILFKILPQVGLWTLLDWMRHFVNLGFYTAVDSIIDRNISVLVPFLSAQPPAFQYRIYRALEAFKYGSGKDYYPSNHEDVPDHEDGQPYGGLQ
ncbi:MAG: FAD-binding oxidoreductase [Cyanobacteria bacterium]|nr:FAD-binding oxidoreductase [Cyanobacteriota bacterium]